MENNDEDKRSVIDMNETYFYLCEAEVLRKHLIWKIPGVWEAALDEGKITKTRIRMFVEEKKAKRVWTFCS